MAVVSEKLMEGLLLIIFLRIVGYLAHHEICYIPLTMCGMFERKVLHALRVL